MVEFVLLLNETKNGFLGFAISVESIVIDESAMPVRALGVFVVSIWENKLIFIVKNRRPENNIELEIVFVITLVSLII